MTPVKPCQSSRLQWMLLIASTCICLTYFFYSPNYQWQSQRQEVPYGADFLQEWTGARMILEGEANALYTDRFVEKQHDPAVIGFDWSDTAFFPAVYPPPHYLIFTPFGAISYRSAVTFWLCVLLASTLLAAMTVQRVVTTGQRGLIPITIAWIVLLLFPPTLLSISLGQKSVLWLLIFGGIAWSLLREKPYAAGILTGILTIKPTLCFLLPIFLLSEKGWSISPNKWKPLIGMGATVLIVWGGSYLILPSDVWVGFRNRLLDSGRYSENAGYRPEWSCTLLSIPTLLPAAWQTAGKYLVVYPLWCASLMLVLADRRSWSTPERWLTLLVGTALLSPHFYHYDLVILFLPLMWIVTRRPRDGVVYFIVLTLAFLGSTAIYRSMNLAVLPVALIAILVHTTWINRSWVRET